MEFNERAKRFVMSVIASVLNTTVAIVERMLPFRPDWLERIHILAAEFNSIEGDAAEIATVRRAPRDTGRPATADAETENSEPLLAAYDALWQFIQKTKVEGLLLDDEFCARVERDWTMPIFLGYMRSAEKSLQERALEAQTIASELMIPDRQN